MNKRVGYVVRNKKDNEYVRDQYKDIVVFATIEDANTLMSQQKWDPSDYTIDRLVKWKKPRTKTQPKKES